MTVKFTNNAWGNITAALNKTDTRILLRSGQGELFPPVGVDSGDYFYATLLSGTDENELEIVKCVGRNANVLTVERAQEGTVAREFPAGTRIENRLTAAAFNAKADVADIEKWETEVGERMTNLEKSTSNELDSVVKTTTQSLSDQEKKRARDNIDTLSKDEIDKKFSDASEKFDEFIDSANDTFVKVKGDTMTGALTVKAEITALGKVTGQSFQTTSDKRLKFDFEQISSDEAQEIVKALQAYRFKRRDDMTRRIFAGTVAQEVEEVLPEAVSEDGYGYKSVDYSAVVAVLIPVLQSLMIRVEKLEKARTTSRARRG